MTNKVNKTKMNRYPTNKKELEEIWFNVYDILSNSGFDILIDDNDDKSMIVYHSHYEMILHPTKGMMLKKNN